MTLASDLGLPVEALNSAADFFVRRIPGWREDLEVFRRGARGVVYRPSPTLFLLLKLSRLSERDLDDCLAAVTKVQTDGWVLDRAHVVAALDALAPTDDLSLEQRRRSLRDALAALPPRS